jgi:hypothetical protein
LADPVRAGKGPSPPLADAPYDGDALLLARLEGSIATFRLDREGKEGMLRSCRDLRGVLDGRAGETLQERWEDFEGFVWPEWTKGNARANPAGRRACGRR